MPKKRRKTPAPKRSASSAATPAPKPKSPKASAGQRSALIRIEQIHRIVGAITADSRHQVTSLSLAEELGVSRGTIALDIEAMRVQFGAPLVWSNPRGTYYYSRPFKLHPLLWLDAVEALSLLLACRLPSPLRRAFISALEKMAPMLGGAVSLQDNALESVFSTPADPASDAESRHFALLCEARLNWRQVRIVYQKVQPGSPRETRLVHPLHLVCAPEGCVLVAHDPARDDRRNFNLRRIRDVQITEATFKWPKGFDLKKYLAGGFGRFFGEARYEVRVAFDPAHVPYVKEKPWQLPQNLVVRADGRSEATYRVSHLHEIEEQVLRCAGQAEVLSPPELRARLRAAALAIAATHA